MGGSPTRLSVSCTELLALRPPLLRAVGIKLDLSDEVICTAAAYFHKFYAVHSRDGDGVATLPYICPLSLAPPHGMATVLVCVAPTRLAQDSTPR